MKDEFSELVSRVLAGEASNEEKNTLRQMLLESNEHDVLYNQIKEYWNAGVSLSYQRNKTSFESNLMSQLNLEPKAEPFKFRRLYFRIASAAAILFFVAACTFFYLYTTAPGHLYTYSAQSAPMEYVLSDGTKVKLNKNSSVTFQSDYGDERRDVQLKGEAFFMVTKDKTRPFTVEVSGTKTQVLGTSFNVKAESGNVTTTLVEGSVRFMAEKCEVVLKPGEEISYNTASRKYESYAADPQLNTAWVSGRFNYDNVTFGVLADKLEQIYKLNIEIGDKRIANRIVSASFLSDEPVEDILKALENELSFKYIIKDSTQINIVSKPL